MDFNGAARSIVKKQIEEWVSMGVAQEVRDKPECISPLLLIPTQNKKGFCI